MMFRGDDLSSIGEGEGIERGFVVSWTICSLFFFFFFLRWRRSYQLPDRLICDSLVFFPRRERIKVCIFYFVFNSQPEIGYYVI